MAWATWLVGTRQGRGAWGGAQRQLPEELSPACHLSPTFHYRHRGQKYVAHPRISGLLSQVETGISQKGVLAQEKRTLGRRKTDSG